MLGVGVLATSYAGAISVACAYTKERRDHFWVLLANVELFGARVIAATLHPAALAFGMEAVAREVMATPRLMLFPILRASALGSIAAYGVWKEHLEISEEFLMVAAAANVARAAHLALAALLPTDLETIVPDDANAEKCGLLEQGLVMPPVMTVEMLYTYENHFYDSVKAEVHGILRQESVPAAATIRTFEDALGSEDPEVAKMQAVVAVAQLLESQPQLPELLEATAKYENLLDADATWLCKLKEAHRRAEAEAHEAEAHRRAGEEAAHQRAEAEAHRRADEEAQWQDAVAKAMAAAGALRRVAAGGFHTAALTSKGRVLCWGSDLYGRCSRVPAAEPGESFIGVAAGGAHTAALTSKGRVLCWGFDEYGQCSRVPAKELQKDWDAMEAENLAASMKEQQAAAAVPAPQEAASMTEQQAAAAAPAPRKAGVAGALRRVAPRLARVFGSD